VSGGIYSDLGPGHIARASENGRTGSYPEGYPGKPEKPERPEKPEKLERRRGGEAEARGTSKAGVPLTQVPKLPSTQSPA
jgi:hypothetical protein